MSNLYYKLYNPCGLFNQITSLEVGVGLSKVLNKQLVLHNISNLPNSDYNNARVSIYSPNYQYNDRKGLIDSDVFPNIVNLVDWENKKNTILINESIDSFINEDVVIEDLMLYYYSECDEFSEEENYFSETRKKLPTEGNIHLKKTLGYYSRFFYNRDYELSQSINSVKFKKEYYEIAYKIAKSLGDFNGAHLRLTDHTRYSNITLEHFDKGLDTMNGSKMVLCTDEPNHPIVKKSSHNFILLDEYILQNFYKDFRELEFKEEVSFGILNNIVMHYSNDFIGTPGSTFSGYIQRSINQSKDYQWKLFNTAEHVQNGPYSWNGHFQDTITKQWWREWKESRIIL